MGLGHGGRCRIDGRGGPLRLEGQKGCQAAALCGLSIEASTEVSNLVRSLCGKCLNSLEPLACHLKFELQG